MSHSRRPPRDPSSGTDDAGSIVVLAGTQRDGTTFQLDPVARELLRSRYPGAHQAPSLFIGYDSSADPETFYSPMWPQILTLLTGVSLDRLRELGPVRIVFPGTGRQFEVPA